MIEIEHVPDEDLVSRTVSFPAFEIVGSNQLNWKAFLSLKKGCLSVIWRKYMESDAEVHQIALAREKENIKQKYQGFWTANIFDVRNIQFETFKLIVEHDPTDNQGIYHVHIKVDPSIPSKLTRERLRELLQKSFEKLPFVEYKK